VEDAHDPPGRIGLVGLHLLLGSSDELAAQADSAQEGGECSDPNQMTVGRVDLADCLSNYSAVLMNLNQLPKSEAMLRQACESFETLCAGSPSVPAYQVSLGRTLINLGAVLSNMKRFEDAEACFRRALELEERLADVHPEAPEHAVLVAECCQCVGECLGERKKLPDALKWYDRAIKLATHNETVDGSNHRTRFVLREAHVDRAVIREEQGHYAEAIKDWDQALRYVEAADKSKREGMRMLRALTMARAGEHAAAIQEADALVAVATAPQVMVYSAACVYAIASATVKNDHSRADSYAAKAVALLRRARQFGPFEKPAHDLTKDSKLDPLRSRPDFQELVAELGVPALTPARKGTQP
jgi:tetratricopeptide (TPR) repeat protein